MKIPTNMLALKNEMIEQINQSFDKIISEELKCNLEECSAELISGVTKCLDKTINEAARLGLESFIQSFETELPKTSMVDGIEHRFNKISTNTFLTIFGPIKLQRALYYPSEWDENQQACTNTKAHIPLDHAWGMAGRTVTPEVVEPVLFASASMENREISQLFDKMASLSLSPSAIYQIRLQQGGALHDWVQSDEGLQARLKTTQVPEQTKALVVGLDGANLPLREAAPKRGRPMERPSSERATHGQNKPKESCYKNAMVGSFSFYGTNNIIDMHTSEKRTEALRLSSLYTAQMPEERFGGFKREFELTLDHLEKDLPLQTAKVLLLDGGKPLWGYLESHSERFADYEKLLDYFHASEHLSRAAEAIFGKKDSEGEKWYQKWGSKLKNDEDGVDALVRSLRYYRDKMKLPKSRREQLAKEIGFFQRNAKWMNYASFVKRHLPIGSGPTEAACKTIVKERMCRSGMRWDREKGKPVLTIRAISKSNQWDCAWHSFYENCWNLAA